MSEPASDDLHSEKSPSEKLGVEKALPLFLTQSLGALKVNVDAEHPSPIDPDLPIEELMEDAVRRVAYSEGFYDIDVDEAVGAAIVRLRELDKLTSEISLEDEKEEK